MKRWCCAAVLLLATLAAGAEEWPRFRGPTGQGVSHESHLTTHWSATDNIAWKAAIPGVGWSSPIVWGDRVFLTTAADGGQDCHVLALSRMDGKRLWDLLVSDNGIVVCLKAATGKPLWQARLSGSYSASPVYAGGRVYFLSEQGQTTVLAADAKFQVIARNNLPGPCQALMPVSHGQLFIRTGGQVFCVGRPGASGSAS